MAVLTDPAIAEALERIVVAGVALTSVAISSARPGFELTLPQWRVLVVLGQTANGARISEVAARVGVTLPATSRQLRRLERRGLVAVSPDDRDRRAVVVRLTDEGRAAWDEIRAYRRARIVELTRPFEGNVELRRALDRIADALTQAR